MTKAEFVDYLRAVMTRERDEFPLIEMVEDGDGANLVVEAGGTRFQLDVRITGPSIDAARDSEPEMDEERITRAINASIEDTRIHGMVSPDGLRQSLEDLYARKRAERDTRRETVND